MKPSARGWLQVVLWSSLLGLARPAGAQVEAFRFDSTRVPVGRLFEYVKSNRDGSHPGQVSLYVAAIDRIESLKWAPGDTVATLVIALLDWKRFSVRRFESWGLARGAVPKLRAALETDSAGAGIRLSFQPDSLFPIHRWPWHSYDFDFASLNLTLAHLRDPEARFSFERADITYADTGPPFADMGAVQARFLRRENRRGRRSRLYELTGPGLRHRRGMLWAAIEGAYVVEYEIPFPDEPGYTDVRFRLRSMESLSPADWEAYWGERVRGP